MNNNVDIEQIQIGFVIDLSKVSEETYKAFCADDQILESIVRNTVQKLRDAMRQRLVEHIEKQERIRNIIQDTIAYLKSIRPQPAAPSAGKSPAAKIPTVLPAKTTFTKTEKSVAFRVRLDEVAHKKLLRLARTRGVSQNTVINQLIQENAKNQ